VAEAGGGGKMDGGAKKTEGKNSRTREGGREGRPEEGDAYQGARTRMA